MIYFNSHYKIKWALSRNIDIYNRPICFEISTAVLCNANWLPKTKAELRVADVNAK